MPLSIIVAIRTDPRKTTLPVEALRIALGLGAGDNPLTVLLLGEAPRLLTEDDEEILDGEILEKYLPSLQQLEVPFVVEEGATTAFELDPEFNIREASPEEIASLVTAADRALVF